MPAVATLTVTEPVLPVTPKPVPAARLVTPVFVIVTVPVPALRDMPVPATLLVTPAFDNVTAAPSATEPPPPRPVPAVTVTLLLTRFELATVLAAICAPPTCPDAISPLVTAPLAKWPVPT